MDKPTNNLTHLDAAGRANMVDVGAKANTERVAVATARVIMAPATLAAISEGEIGKGDVFAVARIAGIQAAKQCSSLIPLCHPLMLNSVKVELETDQTLPGVLITATCKVSGKTGVEMEALTAASIAGLTIYDMCKAIDREMSLEAVQLEHKQGGASGDWHREETC